MVTRDNIIDRLKHLGYTATEDDYDAIDFELNEVINYTMNYCHITEIPEIVEPRLIDRACSYFLYYKKNSGSLKDFNYDAVIKEVREGDTTIKYAVGQGEDTPENRFDAFVKKLELSYDKWITPHRRLVW